MANKLVKLASLLTRSQWRRGLRQGMAAGIEHRRVIGGLALGSVIDVGANKGQFSLLVRSLHVRAVIHAIEPLDQAATVFDRVFAGDPLTHLHRVAAGPRTGTTQMHLAARADSSSLLPIGALQLRFFPSARPAGTRQVDVARIDDLIDADSVPAPLMIKLDVQGFELEALKGMARLLSAARYVYLEVSWFELYEGQPLAHEVIAWLAARGFTLRAIVNMTVSSKGELVQADALFVAPGPN